MANYQDADALLGRRFVADFRVVNIDADPDRTVTLCMLSNDNERYKISFEELQTIIERGFVVEAEERVTRI